MLEFLSSQNSSEAPSFQSILLAVLSAFFLSSLIVLTYDLTSRDQRRSADFLQSLALISIVAATVMQAIGDSLARGLGMLGALAIIRFRTRVDSPRNMTFMFASLAVGISCGVFGFTIAFMGTFLFCAAALVLRFTRFAHTSDLSAELRIVMPSEANRESEVEALLSKHCRKWSVSQYRTNETGPRDETTGLRRRQKEINYELIFRHRHQSDALLEELHAVEQLEDIRLRFNPRSIQV